MEINEVRTLPPNDSSTSILKILIDFVIEEFPGLCVGVEIKTGEKYYFHWDLPRLTHIMRRDADKTLFEDATIKLWIDALHARLVVTRKA